jgi:HlyD family secretion protein
MTNTEPAPTSERSNSPPAETDSPFRDRALGGTPNPLERIDHLFHQTSRRIWLGVLGLAVLLAAGVVWTTVARQTITAEAPAVIVPPAGIFAVGELPTGVVGSVLVREGAVVRGGQPLAEVVLAQSGRKVSVRSPVTGRVVAVEVRPGDTSQAGSPMFRVVPLSRPMAIALFPAAGISQLAVGQHVAVTVNGVSPERYGKAIGRVVSIGPIPASDLRLKQLTGDSSLLGLVSTLGALREVRIRLTPARTPSGLAWTHGHGPAAPPPAGVHAVASVTIKRQTLIGKAFG